MNQKPKKILHPSLNDNKHITSQYYYSSVNHLNTIINIEKKKLYRKNYSKVNHIINKQIQIAKNENYKIFAILYNIRIKVINHIEQNKKLPTHKDLLGIISNRYILLASYRTTKKNNGSMQIAHPLTAKLFSTLSKEEKKIINKSYGLPDGLTWEIIDTIGQLIKKGYPWSKQIYIHKACRTKEQNITIPPYADKMIQNAITMVLESIYEPVFQKMNCSFGFRSSTSVHDAIYNIKTQQNISSMTTSMKGNVKKVDVSLDHHIIIKILKERIKDKKFLKFIKLHLKIILFNSETTKNETTFLGLPPDLINFPYIWNIYLMGMDKFIKNDIQGLIKYINTKRRSQKNSEPIHRLPINPEYNRIKKLYVKEKSYLNLVINKKLGKEIYFQTLKKKRLLAHQLTQLNYYDPHQKKFKIIYVRYANQFIILTNASKNINQKIKTKLSNWLLENRKLTMCPEKIQLTDLTKNPTTFLGFELMNKYTKKIYKGSNNIRQKTNWNIKLGPDSKYLINRLYIKGYCHKNGFPKEISILSTIEAYSLIEKTNSLMIYLANYYVNHISYKSSLNRLLYIVRWSCIKTLAQKYNTNVSGVLKKHPKFTAKMEVQLTNKKKIFKSVKLLTEKKTIKNAEKINMYHQILNKKK
uniref:Putative reverse transcriptase/maturase n=1 Tax=Bulboplastis apyrenoidosa TaxID=1070855 RepID=A0A1Y9TMG2_9RHOD|nr:putative reverse transcriptase/maturase [Bulboplastis apyrenoidosa]ARO90837.1 putative reverse transcriptase/maturase [Bulboplastis apyrenoidosa]